MSSEGQTKVISKWYIVKNMKKREFPILKKYSPSRKIAWMGGVQVGWNSMETQIGQANRVDRPLVRQKSPILQSP